jgi:hypothetical protein
MGCGQSSKGTSSGGSRTPEATDVGSSQETDYSGSEEAVGCIPSCEDGTSEGREESRAGQSRQEGGGEAGKGEDRKEGQPEGHPETGRTNTGKEGCYDSCGRECRTDILIGADSDSASTQVLRRNLFFMGWSIGAREDLLRRE